MMLISSLNHRSASQQSHSARTKCHLTWCNFMESCLVILYSVWLRGEVLWTSRKLQSQLSVKHLARPYNWEVGKSFKEACTLGWLWFSHVAIRKKANPFPKNIWTCTLRGAPMISMMFSRLCSSTGKKSILQYVNQKPTCNVTDVT